MWRTVPDPHASRRVLLGLVLVVVLVVALVIGAQPKGASDPLSRAHALDADIRCPSCENISVAVSESSSALAVRREILHGFEGGESATQIEDRLIGQYGPSIVLRPATSGFIGLVWFIPALIAVSAGGVVATIFYRRSRQLRRLEPTMSAE